MNKNYRRAEVAGQEGVSRVNDDSRPAGEIDGLVAAAKKEREKQENLLERLARIASEVPDDQWDKLPWDLSRNLDHYLYRSNPHS